MNGKDDRQKESMNTAVRLTRKRCSTQFYSMFLNHVIWQLLACHWSSWLEKKCMFFSISNRLLWEGLISSTTIFLTTALYNQAACGVTSDQRNIMSIPLCHWHKDHHYQYPAKRNSGNSICSEAKYWANNLWYKREFQSPGAILDELSILECLWS